jgi:hypothetical protein
MSYNLVERKKVFRKLVERFNEFVIPEMESVEFVPSVLGAGEFGYSQGNYSGAFLNLFRPDELEMVDFWIDHTDPVVVLKFNRYRLSEEIDSLERLSGKWGQSLYLPPYSRTEMEIERLLPIPFLYWVLPYRVKWNKKDVDLDAAVMKQVERVCGDLRHIDVVRTEWESKLEPLPLDVESLE